MFKRAILLLTLSGLIYEAHGIEIPETPVKIGTYDLAVAINSPVGKEMLASEWVQSEEKKLKHGANVIAILQKLTPTVELEKELLEKEINELKNNHEIVTKALSETEQYQQGQLVQIAAQQLLTELNLDVVIDSTKWAVAQATIAVKFPTLDITPQLIEAIIRLKESAVPQD